MGKVEDQLRELMIKKCGSANKFADYIGMPQSTVGNILRRGVNKASINNIFAICKALGISVDKLADGEIAEPKDKIRKEISKNILFFREQRGYSREELAEKIDVNPLLVVGWEDENREIDLDTLNEICEVLDITIVDMLGKFVPCIDNVFFAEEKENLYKVRKLNADGKRYVVKQIDYALQQEEYLLKKEDSKEA